eukprot:TRINITY_DN60016_c0_g1_i1.p1 TRINITY_DN60016_c0_g1~~TRINITY_DN60016_c0_g1_i1.p1  ORF type:complete len:323 (+),score=85.37 TRINITY_DN60016_c0_g1_i1:135-1103(+)
MLRSLVGSEMCIRDSGENEENPSAAAAEGEESTAWVQEGDQVVHLGSVVTVQYVNRKGDLDLRLPDGSSVYGVASSSVEQVKGTPSPVKFAASGTPSPEPVVKEYKKTAREKKEEALQHLDTGDIKQAAVCVDEALRALSMLPNRLSDSCRTLVCYRLMTKILAVLQGQKSLTARALYSCFLANLPALEAKHKKLVLRTALRLHMQASFFSVAERFAVTLLEGTEVDTEEHTKLAANLEQCRSSQDASIPQVNCRQCGTATSPFLPSCVGCEAEPLLCWEQLKLIGTQQYFHCDFCIAVFGSEPVRQSQVCPACHTGYIQQR